MKDILPMENRTARLTLLVDPTKKQIFEEICARRDITSSQVIRQMIRDYVQQYGTPEQLARMPIHE
ncbi:MAG: ribbon-helix-helix protein, CopG family [Methylophilus sp.]